MPKIIKKYEVADAIEESNVRRTAKGLQPITLQDLNNLHNNQPHELAQHLKSDAAHRMLPKFRACTRATHPALMGRAR